MDRATTSILPVPPFDFEMTATDEAGATVKRHGHERLEFNQKVQIRSATVKLKS